MLTYSVTVIDRVNKRSNLLISRLTPNELLDFGEYFIGTAFKTKKELEYSVRFINKMGIDYWIISKEKKLIIEVEKRGKVE